MTDQSEFSSRAELCRKLAAQEPSNRTLWIAEAETWARRSNRIPDAENRVETDLGMLARLLEEST